MTGWVSRPGGSQGPGFRQDFAGTVPPVGWLECNGATISRTAYAALFAAIGTTYGGGDGATTFGLPDTRDDFVRGASPGRPVGTRAGDSTRSHTHTHADSGDYVYDSVVGPAYANGAGDAPTNRMVQVQRSTGASGGAETSPRHVVMLSCIKY